MKRDRWLWALVAVLAMVVVPAPATEHAPEVVMSSRVELHDPGVPLNTICRTGHHVDACTDWVDERFEARCERVEDGWRLAVRIRFEMVIHLGDRRLIGHERLHIDDVRTGLPAKLATLLATRFDEKDSCDPIARLVSAPDFTRSVMNELRVETNAKRGCTRRAMGQPGLVLRARR